MLFGDAKKTLMLSWQTELCLNIEVFQSSS